MSTNVVPIEAADAIEAAELAAVVESPLAKAGPWVTSDLEAFAAPYTLLELQAELIAPAATLGASTVEQR